MTGRNTAIRFAKTIDGFVVLCIDSTKKMPAHEAVASRNEESFHGTYIMLGVSHAYLAGVLDVGL